MSPRPLASGDGARTVNPHDTKCTASWWADHAQPEQRDSFMDAAKVRHVERVRLDDLREGKKNQAMRHVVYPSNAPTRAQRERRK